MRINNFVSGFKDLVFLGRRSANVPVENRDKTFDPKTLGEKTVYLQWTAVSRAGASAFNPKLMRTLIIVGVVIAMLLVMMQEFALILIVASIIFITHVLSKTAPEQSTYELSNHGVKIGTEIYYWHELRNFFFTLNVNIPVLVVDTTIGIPSRLFLTINEGDRDGIKEFMSKYIEYLPEEPKTPIDKFFENLFSKFNILQN